MAALPKLPTQLRELVRQRATYLCEYCQTNERWQYVRFTIDHVVPLRAGGSDDFENLALSCFHCNRRKSNKQTAIDPLTTEEVQLFNPRKDEWLAHFSWSSDGLEIQATTAAGRATIELLEMNRARIIEIRRVDVVAGRHPPATIK
jgi:5-methylcytosine-specific restriction endonuclease McrA